jgi:hypothetical protein
MRTSRKILSLISLILIIVTALPTLAFASETGEVLGKHSYIAPTVGTCQEKSRRIPDMDGKDKLTANAWRSTIGEIHGNTVQWDFLVSAVYSGNETVKSIKTTWEASANLRNSASLTLGVGERSFTYGASSGWSKVSTGKHSWTNSNGAKTSDCLGNIVIGPHCDYRLNSINLKNTASLMLSNDPKLYTITAGV